MSRWLALFVSSFLSLTAAWFYLDWRSSAGEDVALVESDVEGARAKRPEPPAVSSIDSELLAAEPWLAYAFHVPRESARKLFPQLKSRVTTYDPWCGFVYKPNVVTGKAFPEHPDGKYEKRANSLGIRSEREPRAVKPELRILVAGDSHVDGVCYPPEGYPALMEGRLAETLGAENVEVLNAAHGGYSFYNYLGVLERFLHLGLEPDLFVMTVFAGNDFLEIQSPTRFFATGVKKKRPQNSRYSEFSKKRSGAEGSRRSAFAQGLGTTGYFACWPEELEELLGVALDLTARAKARCDERGIEMLVVLLPTPAELPDQADRELIESCMELTDLLPEDIDRVARLRERFVGTLREKGIATFDLYPAFAQHEGRLYWSQDLHISVEGHALAAELVSDEVLRLLED